LNYLPETGFNTSISTNKSLVIFLQKILLLNSDQAGGF